MQTAERVNGPDTVGTARNLHASIGQTESRLMQESDEVLKAACGRPALRRNAKPGAIGSVTGHQRDRFRLPAAGRRRVHDRPLPACCRR